MSKKHQPLSDLERFELVRAMFPELLGGDADMGDEEDVIRQQWDIDPEDFDDLAGRLCMMAMVMQSPLSGEVHHVLGEVALSGDQCHMVALVKREAAPC